MQFSHTLATIVLRFPFMVPTPRIIGDYQGKRIGVAPVQHEARILLADDDKVNLRLMELVLLSLGHQVILAGDGDEALSKAKTVLPDLIFLNAVLPGAAGLEVARQLKEDEATRTIPLVVMTRPDETDLRAKALEAGTDDFLTKPVEKTELRARVSSLLKVKALNEYLRDHDVKLKAEVDQRMASFKQSLEKVKRASLDTIYRLSRARTAYIVPSFVVIFALIHSGSIIDNKAIGLTLRGAARHYRMLTGNCPESARRMHRCFNLTRAVYCSMFFMRPVCLPGACKWKTASQTVNGARRTC